MHNITYDIIKMLSPENLKPHPDKQVARGKLLGVHYMHQILQVVQ